MFTKPIHSAEKPQTESEKDNNTKARNIRMHKHHEIVAGLILSIACECGQIQTSKSNTNDVQDDVDNDCNTKRNDKLA